MQQNEARRAQLVAAAEALVSWMHARRATWGDLPAGAAPASDIRRFYTEPALPSTPAAMPPPPAPKKARSIPAAIASGDTGERSSALSRSPLAPETPHADGTSARRRWFHRLAAALRSILRPASLASVVAPLLDWSRRRAAYAALATLLLGVAWMGRPYWTGLTTRVAPGNVPAAAQPPPVAPTTGQLLAQSDPPGARVIVDGKPLGVTPLTVEDLSLGRHTVVLESDQGSIRRVVTVAADRPALVSEAIYAGFLKVFAPFELNISDGTRAIRLDDQNQAMLPPGSYQLQLENAALGYKEARRVDVSPGQTTTVSVVPGPSTLTVTANVPAVVLIDGQQAGPTPLTNYPIPLGTRDIIVRSAAGPERRYTRRVTVAPLQLDVDFSRP